MRAASGSVRAMPVRSPYPAALLVAVLAVLGWSAVAPYDRFTWFLEVAPALLGLAVLLATRRRFPLTPLVYTLVALHMILLCVGGKYTYALVPLGNWVRDVFELSRNHYDRLGHFAQGFVPAMVAREILLRKRVVTGAAWLVFLIVCICMAISATYELVEWMVALGSGEASDSFLGTQGDPWDTQEDMAMALVGAVSALGLLGAWHNRQLARLTGSA